MTSAPSLSDLREVRFDRAGRRYGAVCLSAGLLPGAQALRRSQAEADRLADLDAVANRLELIIEKQRSGPIGTIDLWCDMASNVVRDPAESPTKWRWRHDHVAKHTAIAPSFRTNRSTTVACRPMRSAFWPICSKPSEWAGQHKPAPPAVRLGRTASTSYRSSNQWVGHPSSGFVNDQCEDFQS